MTNENEKKIYEEPTVQKVEFDFSEVITASECQKCDIAIVDSLNAQFEVFL